MMNVYTSLTVNDQAEALPSVPRPDTPISDGTNEPERQDTGPVMVPATVPRGAGRIVFAAQGAAGGARRLASDGYQSAPDCTEEPKNESAGTPGQVGRSGVASRADREKKHISRQEPKRRGGETSPRRFPMSRSSSCLRLTAIASGIYVSLDGPG